MKIKALVFAILAVPLAAFGADTPVAPTASPAPGASGAPTVSSAQPETQSPKPNTLLSPPSLDPKPAAGSVALPPDADALLGGYGTQAQQSLILAYFASGTLGDALGAGSISKDQGASQAASYLALATAARDDLRHVRGSYTLGTQELDFLDKLAVAYDDVIPMIEADKKLAASPKDPAALADFQAARRKAFATLSVLFGWK